MKYLIREATVEDAEGRGYVHYQSWNETYLGLMDDAYLASKTLEERVNTAKAHPENTLVAIVDGKIVGFCCYLGHSRDFVSLQPSSEITALYVLQDYQWNGIGHALLDEALKKVKGTYIFLYVLCGNQKAISFYEHYGFHFTGKELAYDVGMTILHEREMLLSR